MRLVFAQKSEPVLAPPPRPACKWLMRFGNRKRLQQALAGAVKAG
jgi:hypothetical protein